MEKFKNKNNALLSFECVFPQINRFAEIILDRDKVRKPKPRYKFYRVDEDEDPYCPTILHLAAEKGFEKISKTIVEHYPGLLYLNTEEHGGKRELLPVEVALLGFKDETAAYLIGQMKNEWYEFSLSFSFSFFSPFFSEARFFSSFVNFPPFFLYFFLLFSVSFFLTLCVCVLCFLFVRFCFSSILFFTFSFDTVSFCCLIKFLP